MAITGFVLVGFVIGHLVGNLQVFSPPEKINGYAAFLQGLGPMLWVTRIFLLVCAVLHIWSAFSLTVDNRKARGGPRYSVKHTIRATLASRTMRLTGLVVVAFLVYHLLHFTIGGVDENFKGNLNRFEMPAPYHVLGIPVVAQGTSVLDVHTMVIKGFENPIVSIFYIIAVGLLSYHMLHGVDSAFQTLGLRNHRWSSGLRKLCILFTLAYFLGNLAIPASVLAGRLEPRAGWSKADSATARLHSVSQ